MSINVPNAEWGDLLTQNLSTYSRGRPKRGQFVHAHLEACAKSPRSILELGAFSGKDSLYLKQQYPRCRFVAADKDPNIALHLQQLGLHACVADAFQLPFSDDSFDVTFQSGLLILFSNDDARRIIAEQVRVTRRIAFVFAHNQRGLPDRLGAFIKRTAFRRQIYQFRRYTLEELMEILRALRLEGQSLYYDNALRNVVSRRAPSLTPLVERLGLGTSAYLMNEIALIIWKPAT